MNDPMTVYFVAVTLFHFFFAIIWSKEGFKNVFIKMMFFGFFGVEAFFTLKRLGVVMVM